MVCHGAVGLLYIKLSDGSLLVKDKEVTGFSNEEEKLAELDKLVPFLTETELVKRGAIYKKADDTPNTELRSFVICRLSLLAIAVLLDGTIDQFLAMLASLVCNLGNTSTIHFD